MRLNFTLNGIAETIDTPSGQLLSDIISILDRNPESSGAYIGTAGCREGKCGRCLVIIDGEVRHSCLVPGFSIRGRKIITYEGFKTSDECSVILNGFESAGYSPCRLCLPGRVLLTKALLDKYTMPTDDQIAEGFAAVQCHCSGFLPFYEGVKTAARIRRSR
ncbi:MAG: aldehyde oxidoreductase [Spirochaetales bacterium]|nr:aldehyde oxidoreductase [Spirochaetales bacterium]